MFDLLNKKSKSNGNKIKDKYPGGVLEDDTATTNHPLEHLESAKKVIDAAKELEKKGSSGLVKRRKVV